MLFQNLGITGIIVCGVVWLVKKLSEQLLKRDLEKFKAELQKENKRFEIQFSKLQYERATVIKEIYKKIDGVCRVFNELTSPIRCDEKNLELKINGEKKLVNM